QKFALRSIPPAGELLVRDTRGAKSGSRRIWPFVFGATSPPGYPPGAESRSNMPDPRFFEDLGPVTLIELAAVTGAELARAEDGERRVFAVAPLGKAGSADLSFFADKRYIDDLKATRAGAC